MSLAVYVSGHGFGHATRSVAWLRALRERTVDLAVHVRTEAPHWLFEERGLGLASLLHQRAHAAVARGQIDRESGIRRKAPRQTFADGNGLLVGVAGLVVSPEHREQFGEVAVTHAQVLAKS